MVLTEELGARVARLRDRHPLRLRRARLRHGRAGARPRRTCSPSAGARSTWWAPCPCSGSPGCAAGCPRRGASRPQREARRGETGLAASLRPLRDLVRLYPRRMLALCAAIDPRCAGDDHRGRLRLEVPAGRAGLAAGAGDAALRRRRLPGLRLDGRLRLARRSLRAPQRDGGRADLQRGGNRRLLPRRPAAGSWRPGC